MKLKDKKNRKSKKKYIPSTSAPKGSGSNFNNDIAGNGAKKASGKKHGAKSSGRKAGIKSGGRKGGLAYEHKKIKPKTVVGKLESSGRGFAFLVVEGAKDDAFIAGSDLLGAMHGDTVEAAIVSYKKAGGEAIVKKILERGSRRVVGTYFKNNFGGYIIPDDNRIAPKIFVNKGGEKGANNLDKVVLQPDFRGFDKGFHTLNGEIVEVLGAIDAAGVDILSVVRSYNLYEHFKNSVLQEAKTVAVAVDNNAKKGRRDFTQDIVFTIDGDDSKDFDDAVSLEILDNGNYKLNVHIADVAHYVKDSSKLDKEAFMRGTSVYFVDRVLPMLPEILSNDICSLNENVLRLSLSCLMEIDSSGSVVNYEVCEGVIKSRARLTYSKVSKVLAGEGLDKKEQSKYDELLPILKQMEKLAAILYNKRKARGNIDFDLPESQIILDENKKAIDIIKKPRLIAHKIIEEFMLAANETVAKHLGRIKAPGVFRVHENPPTAKFESLQALIKALAIDFEFNSEQPTPSEFNDLLNAVKGSKYEMAISRTALRTMAKANYEPADKGHFGLASSNYCHFTSPIRRYPDLCVHRIVKDHLANGNKNLAKYVEFTVKASTQSSVRERLAEKAEREVDDIKKAEFMQDKIGNSYSGVISGVTDFGIFIELESTVEGLIRVESLPGFGYEFIENQMMLSNKVNSYRIGDSVDIVVVAISGSKIEFELVQ